jgi:hypothetical protein
MLLHPPLPLCAWTSAGLSFHFLKKGASSADTVNNLLMQNPDRTLLILARNQAERFVDG